MIEFIDILYNFSKIKKESIIREIGLIFDSIILRSILNYKFFIKRPLV